MQTIDPGTTGRRYPGTTGRRSTKKLPARKVCERYGVCDRTVDRWVADPKLNFPKPMRVNKRRYWDEGELDDFDRSCAEADLTAEQPAGGSDHPRQIFVGSPTQNGGGQ